MKYIIYLLGGAGFRLRWSRLDWAERDLGDLDSVEPVSVEPDSMRLSLELQ